MALPLVPLSLIGIGTASGAGGTALVAWGSYNLRTANASIRKAEARYNQERRKLEAREADTNESLKALGGQQERAVHLVVERMADFLRSHARQVKESEKLLVDGLEPSPGQVEIGGSLDQAPLSWLRGIVGMAATGVGINQGLTKAVKDFAPASTGTPIASLSGAAERNAIRAAFGGGSKASGGAGKAVGTAALHCITIGPAILVSSLVVAGQGQKAKTKASQSESRVKTEMAEMEETMAKFDAVVARASELETLIWKLVVRATAALDLLESEPFDPARHADRFRQALTLTTGVRDVASTQVVDETGALNEKTTSFKVKYRTLLKEAEDV